MSLIPTSHGRVSVRRMKPRPTSPSARLLWLLLLLTSLAAVRGIDQMPLFEPDEGRNAEVAREMSASGDWVVPRFHGLPYLDKPALYFDAVALSDRLFGTSEGAARLPSLLFAAGAALATFLLGRALWSDATGGLAALVLATSPLFFGFARIVIFDIPLTCFVVLAWWAAERGRQGAAWGHPLAWVFIGLAVLVKGPVGLLLGVVGHVAMALGQAPPRRMGRFFHPLHLVLFALVLAPWVTAMELRNPGFLRYAVLIETMERLTQPTFQRTGPIWYYAPVLLLGLLPWSLVALARCARWLVRGRRWLAATPERGVGFAATALVVFFSLSKSKLGGYVLPVVPLLALLIARSALRAGERRGTWSVAPGVALVLIAIGLLAAGLGDLTLAPRLRQPADLEPALDTLLVRSGAITLIVGFALLLLGRGARRGRALDPGALHADASVLRHDSARGVHGPHLVPRAGAPLVAAGGANARVVAVRCFPTGIDWYLRRIVPVVTENGRELTSTYVARNFESLRAAAKGLWSPQELTERRARRGRVPDHRPRRGTGPAGGSTRRLPQVPAVADSASAGARKALVSAHVWDLWLVLDARHRAARRGAARADGGDASSPRSRRGRCLREWVDRSRQSASLDHRSGARPPAARGRVRRAAPGLQR